MGGGEDKWGGGGEGTKGPKLNPRLPIVWEIV